MGVIANVKEYNTLKAIDDLSKVNFKLSDGLTAEKLNETLNSIDKGVNDKTMEMAQLMRDIVIQENNIRNWNERIDNYKEKLAGIKEKMGMAKIVSFINPEYRKIKKNVRTLKKLKKRAAEDIIKKYAQYKLKKQQQKSLRRSRKQVAKEIKEYAKERKEEIKIVKYFEKNKRKIFRKDPKNYEKIQNMIDIIMDNGGKWPENVYDEKGNIVTLEEALEMVKSGKARDLKQKEEIDQNREGEEIPQEENNEEKKEEKQEEEHDEQEEQKGEQKQEENNEGKKEEKQEEEHDEQEEQKGEQKQEENNEGKKEEKQEQKKQNEIKEEESDPTEDYYNLGWEKPKDNHAKFIEKINGGKTLEELRQEAEEAELRAQEVAAKAKHDRQVSVEEELRQEAEEAELRAQEVAAKAKHDRQVSVENER